MDTLSEISSLVERVRRYVLDVFEGKNIEEMNRLLSCFPELLYHQYHENGIWHDLAWDVLDASEEKPEPSLAYTESILSLFKKLDYTPSGMFRERLVSKLNPELLTLYIDLFERDTAAKYVDVDGKEYSSLIALSMTFINASDQNNKEVGRFLTIMARHASAKELNKPGIYGYFVNEFLDNNTAAGYPLIIHELINKGLRIDPVVYCRSELALEYFNSKGLSDKIVPHPVFTDQSCVRIPLRQDCIFSMARSYEIWPSMSDTNIGNQLKLFSSLIPIWRKQNDYDQMEDEQILEYFSIEVLSEAYFK